MASCSRRALSSDELQRIADELSDIEYDNDSDDIPYDSDDSIMDPDYESDDSSSTSEESVRSFPDRNEDLLDINMNGQNEIVIKKCGIPRYAEQKLSGVTLTRSSRLTRWKNTSLDEMRQFLGIIMLIDFIQFSTIESYWKKHRIYYHKMFHEIGISYNRFTLLLRMWHFVDSTNDREPSYRTYKIQSLLDKIFNNIQDLYLPGNTIVIDESMLPFRGRLVFRQYNPSKAHKYGIKVYKLYSTKGFVWNLTVYTGKNIKLPGLDHSGSVVISLMEKLLGSNRLLITDNYYTSIPLAQYLYDRQINLCGTFRLPGDIIARQKKYITVLKWHDKRDVIMLSTCHDDRLDSVGKNRKDGTEKKKPRVVIDYNSAKQSIDVSDQLSSYYSPVRKSLTWYKKIAYEVIFGVVVVNSFLIYKELKLDRKMQLKEFTEAITDKLLPITVVPVQEENKCTSTQQHYLEKMVDANGTIQKKEMPLLL
ncbi:hypothetical protein NQ314_010973 [Rhamnusium bicolor]|uniref:PiggyBac transposable element-derived protein domain-containing protein n=1 Tax=Rhamnusium bicolor TaxID=1586634 RepID=A0AAV8XLB8_9CUCU|nr:hypothetical protein NQ314_010973 [Rhamnusium bicolor]